MQRSTGAASATDLPNPATTTAPLTQSQSASSVSSLPLLESGALISALLLNPTHDSVRSLAVSLLKQLCLGTPHMTIRLVSRLAALLPQASAAGERVWPYLSQEIEWFCLDYVFLWQYFSSSFSGCLESQMANMSSAAKLDMPSLDVRSVCTRCKLLLTDHHVVWPFSILVSSMNEAREQRQRKS